jgi:hypothetical protein
LAVCLDSKNQYYESINHPGDDADAAAVPFTNCATIAEMMHFEF